MPEPKFDITKEKLLSAGWTENKDDIIYVEKIIPNRNPINAGEDSDIKLILHGIYNTQTFAVLLPDGGMLNFVANSMAELEAFERAINFYDPPF